MKAIRCTKSQFNEFKHSTFGNGKETYRKMMEHFKRTSPDRYNAMQYALDLYSEDEHRWLYEALEISSYVYNNYASMHKDLWSGYKTIDGQKYIFISLDKANRHLNYIKHKSGLTWPKSYYISQTLDFLNTYLCTYNL